MSLKQEFAGFKSALIIHHWDTDGIASASLLSDQLPNASVVNRTPKVGSYRLTEKILAIATGDWDAIIVADIRLPDSDFEKLANIAPGKVTLFDHHLGKRLPGITEVRERFLSASGRHFPATSWMVKEAFQLPISLRSLLGVVGDKGGLEFSEPQNLADARDFLSKQRLDAETLGKISDLLDSSAQMGDDSLVEQAVSIISKDGEDAQSLLRNPTWLRQADMLEQEISRQMQESEELHNGIAVKRFHSKFDIVSAVARKMAWSGNYRTAVALNSGFLPDDTQLYIRKGTHRFDSKAIIQLAHEKGYSAGGKEEVVGAVLPKTETESFLHQILTRLVE